MFRADLIFFSSAVAAFLFVALLRDGVQQKCFTGIVEIDVKMADWHFQTKENLIMLTFGSICHFYAHKSEADICILLLCGICKI